ncbi:L-glutamate gamma-semialdehyde dehydrogenase [Salinicoccus hispanicus]|uniref:L-glutamate gamma-semialdehyde dehydrogenase n=1 Tax=Salinicoccus hispanicus TaxID=157225 RepID=A0A6N8TXY9_9STAP|nr:L-glutamate gamma-semialdehyde dehydrogenase [Salinicoccus hispanicus]MXQ50828.1 L-glutamate gamma-semialdehyde dehydrogenase [Salinicoccus hispanicus]
MIPYKHEPFTDFSKEENRQKLEEGLNTVKGYLGQDYPLIIGGERIMTDDKKESYNPAHKDETIGQLSQASQEHAQQAMDVALETFETWRKSSFEFRSDVLFKAAAIIRKRKFEFTALLVKEGGKPWKEADADTAEAIDFLEYYGRNHLKLKNGDHVESRPGEYNQFHYIPLGVGLVISPWNFAFAIMAGTTAAAAVTGNTVLLKPSSRTSVIAYKFVEVLEEAGLPKGVVNFIPGSSRDIGDYLVEHKDTRFVSFTGSRDVGTSIFEKAAVVQEGQTHLKRVIAEMGGKDTIVVDSDADLELAAEAIVASAFGFSGQKCSACSRVIALDDIHDELLEKVVEKTKKLQVGNPESDIDVGPVIDDSSLEKIQKYIEIGKEEGKLEVGGETENETGHFVHPTVFSGLKHDDRIMQEEIFGPVVGFAKAKDFDQAIDYANSTDYGLTGAVITKNREHIEQARRDFHVGNLYFNRGCTAAIVGYQPFGGFKMSGTDSKAGGPDYLTLHMQGKTSSEQF